MASTLTEHQRVVFENAALHSAQVKVGRVAQHFMQTTLEGKQKYFQIYGSVSLKEKLVRGQKTVFAETTRSRRAISARTFDFTEFFDEDDEINLMSDAGPNQGLIDGYGWAGARKREELIIEGLLGTAKSGEQGDTDVVFDPAQEIDVSGVTEGGVTFANLLDGIRDLRNAMINPETPIIGIVSPNQLRLFWGMERMTSMDYQDLRVISTAGTGNWLGVVWVMTPLITEHEDGASFAPGYIDGTDEYALILATGESGVSGVRKGVTMKLSDRPDLSDGKQLRVKGVMAATRLFENQVIRYRTLVGAIPSIIAQGNDV